MKIDFSRFVCTENGQSGWIFCAYSSNIFCFGECATFNEKLRVKWPNNFENDLQCSQPIVAIRGYPIQIADARRHHSSASAAQSKEGPREPPYSGRNRGGRERRRTGRQS